MKGKTLTNKKHTKKKTKKTRCNREYKKQI